MKSLRVLQLTKFYSPHLGGIESVTYEITEGLNQKGIVCDVLCANDKACTSVELFNGKYKVFRAGKLGTLFSTSLSFPLLFIFNKIKRNYDIIHVHFPDPLTVLAIFLFRPKAKIVVHWHSDIIKQRIGLFFFLPLQNWVLRRAKKIIGTSPKYIQESPYLSHFHSKCIPVPIGISLDKLKVDCTLVDDIRAKYNGKFIVFSLGRMVYYKGFEYLIEAAKYLSDDYIILIGGEGHLKSQHQYLIRHHQLEKKVVLLGSIPESDLASYYKACDVFCLPSIMHSEAFGVALIEAMSFGKPIITTNIAFSGVSWVNKNNVSGYNVPVRDGEAIADKIKKLKMDSALYAKMSDGARDRFLQKFTSEKMVEQIYNLYTKI